MELQNNRETYRPDCKGNVHAPTPWRFRRLQHRLNAAVLLLEPGLQWGEVFQHRTSVGLVAAGEFLQRRQGVRNIAIASAQAGLAASTQPIERLIKNAGLMKPTQPTVLSELGKARCLSCGLGSAGWN